MRRDENEEVKRGMRTNPQADETPTRVYRPRTLTKRSENSESDSVSDTTSELREQPERRASEHRTDRPQRHFDSTRSYQPRTYRRPEAAEPQHDEANTDAPKHDGYSWSEMPYASKNQDHNEQRDDRHHEGGFRSRDERPFRNDRNDRDGDSFRPRFGNRDGRRSFDRNEGGFRNRDDRPFRNDRNDRDGDNSRPRFGNRDDRRSFDRNEGGFRSRDERPFRNDRNDRDGDSFRPRFGNRDDRRSFDRRDDGFRSRDERPFRNDRNDRDGDSFRPRYGNRDDRRSFDRREDGFRSRENRPFGRDRNDGDNFRPRFGNRDDRRSFDRREGGFRNRENRPFGRDRNGESFRPRFDQHNANKPASPRSRKKVFDFSGDLDNFVFNGPQMPPMNTINEADAAKGLVRLNKYIANSGLCSRREADEYIQNGQITVNGEVVNTLGAKVNSTDEICFRGKKLEAERRVYILMNKPKDYVTTVEDPHATHTVMDLLEGACQERIYPVGRLDRNSTGVLLFTNDGDLTKKLTHPSSRKRKIYQVTLDRKVAETDLETIFNGIELDGERIAVDAVDYTVNSDGTEVGIEIHSGQNRVVRRLFESLNYKVEKLDRVYFAGLTKKNLPRGKWRFLEPKEINMLKMGRF